MEYKPPVDNLLAAVTYGSHLYGTSTPTSDHDFKAVYLPSMSDLILAKSPKVLRFRFDAQGNPVGDSETMPANGYEAEHMPIQKFVHDFLGGQAYAVEMVFAVVQGAHLKHAPTLCTRESRRVFEFEALCHNLAKNYVHKNVNGMVGFAVKQTFDYVRRGERLNSARAVLAVLVDTLDNFVKGSTADGSKLEPSKVRLDTTCFFIRPGSHAVDEQTILDHVARETGLEIGETSNQNKKMRTLKLNGREYLETTTLPHLISSVEKLCEQYGDRSTRAAKEDVDWKSLSHAVRVYQQVIELLETGFITFPRPNAKFLLEVKSGEIEIEAVKELLGQLDDRVQELVDGSTLPAVDDAFRERVEEMLVDWLFNQYGC